VDAEEQAAELQRGLRSAGFEAVDAEHVGDGWAVDFHVQPRTAYEDYNEFASSIYLEAGEPPGVILRMPQVPGYKWDEAAERTRRAKRAMGSAWEVSIAPAEDTRDDVARPHLVWNPRSRSIRPPAIVAELREAVDAYYGGSSGEGQLFVDLGW
jgi:hypothetical protein